MSTKRDLKKLNRKELLEVLTAVSAENERLQALVADLNAQLEQASSQPGDNASIAKMALEANGYFEAAEKAAADYLAKVKEQADMLLKQAQEEATRISAPTPEPEPEPEPTAPEAAPEPEPESERGCEQSG